MPSCWPDAAVDVGAADAVDGRCSCSQSYRCQRYCCRTTTTASIIRRQAAERPLMMMKSATAFVVAAPLEAVSDFFDRKHSMNFVHLLDPFPQRAPTFSTLFSCFFCLARELFLF